MVRSIAIVLTCAAFFFSSSASASFLDSADPNNGFSMELRVGVYKVTYDGGAWNAWGDTLCGPTTCHGWLNSFNILSDDGAVDMDVGAPFDGTWSTPAEAELLGKKASPFMFTLEKAQAVKFYIEDSNYLDNTGGISISVSAVPEPESYAMMLAGLGIVAAAVNRRKGKKA